MAIAVWNALQNGSGGLDWSGLPLHCEFYGVTDVEGLVMRLHTIKMHKPPERGEEEKD